MNSIPETPEAKKRLSKRSGRWAITTVTQGSIYQVIWVQRLKKHP